MGKRKSDCSAPPKCGPCLSCPPCPGCPPCSSCPPCAPCDACDPCPRCAPDCCDPSICYAIFDLESTVFDTRHIYQRACREVVASYNRTLSDEVLIQCGPMETAEMAELICRKCKLPVPWEMFLVLVNEHTFHMIANPPLMAGVERLVAHLKYCNIGLGLVSSCKKAQLCQKIQGRDALFNQFDHIICADDPLINQPKPSPDIYLMAMKRFCCNPCADCFLVFEGTTKGVQAAHDAHMEVVMVSESSLPCCWSEQAAARFETLLDFHPEVYGLPPLPANEPEPPDSSTY